MNIEKIDVGNVCYPIKFLVGKFIEWTDKKRKFNLKVEFDEEYDDPIRAGGRSVREILEQVGTIKVINQLKAAA